MIINVSDYYPEVVEAPQRLPLIYNFYHNYPLSSLIMHTIAKQTQLELCSSNADSTPSMHQAIITI